MGENKNKKILENNLKNDMDAPKNEKK